MAAQAAAYTVFMNQQDKKAQQKQAESSRGEAIQEGLGKEGGRLGGAGTRISGCGCRCVNLGRRCRRLSAAAAAAHEPHLRARGAQGGGGVRALKE